jgi:dynein light intermediate chain
MLQQTDFIDSTETGPIYDRKNADENLDQPRESLLKFLAPESIEEAEKKNQSRKRQSKAARKQNQLQEVLNSLLPPREFVDHQTKARYQQKVSPEPASRHDVVKLQVALDERLQARQARENGICPVREELYSQCFDELIRQVTLNSQERGLLLLRVRDEVRMTIAAYQTLYQASITFGMRKALQAEQGTTQLQQRIAELKQEKERLTGVLADQKGLSDAIEKRISEQKKADDVKMAEEKRFLEYQELHLKNYLAQVMANQANNN